MMTNYSDVFGASPLEKIPTSRFQKGFLEMPKITFYNFANAFFLKGLFLPL